MATSNTPKESYNPTAYNDDLNLSQESLPQVYKITYLEDNINDYLELYNETITKQEIVSRQNNTGEMPTVTTDTFLKTSPISKEKSPHVKIMQ